MEIDRRNRNRTWVTAGVALVLIGVRRP